MQKTFTGPTETLAGCRGKYVLAIQDPADGAWGVIDCHGCNDCDRELVRARMAAEGKFRPAFDGLPCDDDQPW